MKKIAIMLDDGYHDLELWIPYYRFKEEGIKFDILTWEDREYKGSFGIDSIKPDKLLGVTALSQYDLIYMPGAKSPVNLLKHPETVGQVKDGA
ncbi:intracellular protease, PfpI family, partial [mine drainage metagenome]